MREWTKGQLIDIAEIEMGQSPKGENCSTNNIGTPLLNGPTEFGIRYPSPVQYTNDTKRKSKKGDILFCVRGSTTGKMNWANQDFAIGRGLAALRHREGEEYSYFLRGIIDYNLPNLLSSATGSTFPNISKSQLEGLEINIPTLPEQKAIASTLSSLDDKIDLLHRQNATLEGMAEVLFREWFVEGENEDWEEKSLYDCIKLVGGGTPKTSIVEYWNGEIPWLSGGDISSNHKGFVLDSIKHISKIGVKNSSAKLLPKFATVISARGTVGKYCLLAKPMTFSQSNYGVLPAYQDCFFFTYLLIDNVVKELQGAAYGSVFDTITTTTFKATMVNLPSKNGIQDFEKKVSLFFQKMFSNSNQIKTLETLRDTLLPKLMSGEVRVKM